MRVPAAISALLLLAGAVVALAGAASRSIDPPAGPGALGPSLAVIGQDVALTWLEPLKEGHRVMFSRLSGDRWSKPAVIASGPLFANWADFPGVARAADGSLTAHWLQKIDPSEPYAYGIQLARSTDGGATWTPAGRLHSDDVPNEHGFVAWVPEDEGLRAFWLDGRELKGKDGAMTLRTAAVQGKAAGDERIDGRVCDCCQTDAALAAGGPVVAYRDRSPGEIRDIHVIRRTPKGWSEPVRVHADDWKIAGCPVNGPAIAASGRRVAVAWFTAAPPKPRVQVAFSEDGGATFGPSAVVADGKPVGRVDLALDAKGDALVSWIAMDAGQGRIALRRVSPQGRLGPAVPVATARPGSFPRMVLAGDRLVLAWTEDGEVSKIRVAVAPTPPPPTPATPRRP